jgi:hypothetical protein
MADRYRAPGGWTVEVVQLTGTPDHHDGEWLRISQYGVWTADVRTIGELAEWINLAALEPDALAAGISEGSSRTSRSITSCSSSANVLAIRFCS